MSTLHHLKKILFFTFNKVVYYTTSQTSQQKTQHPAKHTSQKHRHLQQIPQKKYNGRCISLQTHQPAGRLQSRMGKRRHTIQSYRLQPAGRLQSAGSGIQPDRTTHTLPTIPGTVSGIHQPAGSGIWSPKITLRGNCQEHTHTQHTIPGHKRYSRRRPHSSINKHRMV